MPWPPRAAVAAGLGLLTLALAGCVRVTYDCPASGCEWSGAGCPAAPSQAVVERDDGLDLGIRHPDGRLAHLHLERSAVHRIEGGACVEADPFGIGRGDYLAFYASGWADSKPGQAWPETVVVIDGPR